MLPLPSFLLGSPGKGGEGAPEGFLLTGYFLERYIFDAAGKGCRKSAELSQGDPIGFPRRSVANGDGDHAVAAPRVSGTGRNIQALFGEGPRPTARGKGA
jgi:hypothetical protein